MNEEQIGKVWKDNEREARCKWLQHQREIKARKKREHRDARNLILAYCLIVGIMVATVILGGCSTNGVQLYTPQQQACLDQRAMVRAAQHDWCRRVPGRCQMQRTAERCRT